MEMKLRTEKIDSASFHQSKALQTRDREEGWHRYDSVEFNYFHCHYLSLNLQLPLQWILHQVEKFRTFVQLIKILIFIHLFVSLLLHTNCVH
jgi:hypothetical protein